MTTPNWFEKEKATKEFFEGRVLKSTHNGRRLSVDFLVTCEAADEERIIKRLEQPIVFQETLTENALSLLLEDKKKLERENKELKDRLAMAEQSLREMRGLR